MKLHRDDVSLCCEKCQYVGSHGDGEFRVKVPLAAQASGIDGDATLRCQVAGNTHRVELIAWVDADQNPVEAGAEVRQQVSGTLDLVAQKRLCGHHRSCPTEVVRIVRENGDQ